MSHAYASEARRAQRAETLRRKHVRQVKHAQAWTTHAPKTRGSVAL